MYFHCPYLFVITVYEDLILCTQSLSWKVINNVENIFQFWLWSRINLLWLRAVGGRIMSMTHHLSNRVNSIKSAAPITATQGKYWLHDVMTLSSLLATTAGIQQMAVYSGMIEIPHIILFKVTLEFCSCYYCEKWITIWTMGMHQMYAVDVPIGKKLALVTRYTLDMQDNFNISEENIFIYLLVIQNFFWNSI